MTSAFDYRHTMKMLAKVARGLDLPPPAAASPPRAAAPLADDETFLDQRWDDAVMEGKTAAGKASDSAGAPLTDIPAGTQHPLETPGADRGPGSISGRPAALSNPAASSDTSAADVDAARRSAAGNAGTASVPSASVSADIPLAKISPQPPLPDQRSPETSAPPTAAPDSAKHPEPSTRPAAPISPQAGSPATVGGASRSTRSERTEMQSEPDRPPAAENPEKPAARWQWHRAAKPGSKASRPGSRMLRPVFDNPDPADAAPPAGIRGSADSLARDRSPAAKRQPDRAATAGELTARPSHKQPAPGAARREPSGDQKAVPHLSSPRPPAKYPRPTQPAAAPSGPLPKRSPNRQAASVGPTVPGNPAAINEPGQPAISAATQERPGAGTDGVSIGRINIQVRGQRQAEDDWPEPPQYTSHSITADWEWSCHYGK